MYARFQAARIDNLDGHILLSEMNKNILLCSLHGWQLLHGLANDS